MVMKEFTIVVSYMFEMKSKQAWGPKDKQIKAELKKRFPSAKMRDFEIDCIDEVESKYKIVIG